MAKTKSINTSKPLVCRLTSLKGFDGVIIGRDIGSVFQAGHVYSAHKVMDVIVIQDLGEHATDKILMYGDSMSGTIGQYFTTGFSFLTKDEYKKEISQRDPI